MKTNKVLLILFAALMGWCGTTNAQNTDLKKRMKDADPKEIGERIVKKFLVTPHTRFGNRKYTDRAAVEMVMYLKEI